MTAGTLASASEARCQSNQVSGFFIQRLRRAVAEATSLKLMCPRFCLRHSGKVLCHTEVEIAYSNSRSTSTQASHAVELLRTDPARVRPSSKFRRTICVVSHEMHSKGNQMR